MVEGAFVIDAIVVVFSSDSLTGLRIGNFSYSD